MKNHFQLGESISPFSFAHKITNDRPSFDDIFKKLSTDFSYFYETVDEEEVETYLESLKTESSDDMSISKLQIKLKKLKIQRQIKKRTTN